MIGNLLAILIFLGVVLGIITGLIIRFNTLMSIEQGQYVSALGSMVFRMFKNIAAVLKVIGLVGSLGNLKIEVTKTLSWQVAVLILCTKVAAVVIAITLVTAINPGEVGEKKDAHYPIIHVSTMVDFFLDVGRNMAPHNIVSMFVQRYRTLLTPPEKYTLDYFAWNVEERYVDMYNTLGVIAVSMSIGISLSILGERRKVILSLVGAIGAIVMEMTHWLLWTTGPFLFFFILAEIVAIDDFHIYVTIWGQFILTFILACLVVCFLFHPLLLFLASRESPLRFYGTLTAVYITAFGTFSNLATLPIFISELERIGIDERLVCFLSPLLINLNKDGTAVYVAVAVIFVAQKTATTLNAWAFVSILLLSILASVAAATVPFSGPVILSMILGGLGLTQSEVGTFLAIDWITERFTVMTNIIGNTVIVKIIEVWNRDLLEKIRITERKR